MKPPPPDQPSRRSHPHPISPRNMLLRARILGTVIPTTASDTSHHRDLPREARPVVRAPLVPPDEEALGRAQVAGPDPAEIDDDLLHEDARRQPPHAEGVRPLARHAPRRRRVVARVAAPDGVGDGGAPAGRHALAHAGAHEGPRLDGRGRRRPGGGQGDGELQRRLVREVVLRRREVQRHVGPAGVGEEVQVVLERGARLGGLGRRVLGPEGDAAEGAAVVRQGAVGYVLLRARVQTAVPLADGQ